MAHESRTTIAVLMVWVFVAAILMSLLRTELTPTSGLVFLASVLFLLPLVRAPIFIYRTHSARATVEFLPVVPADPTLPVGVGPILEDVAREMESLGFACRGMFQGATGPRATGYLAVFEHPQTHEVGELIMAVIPAGAHSRSNCTCWFHSQLPDGTEAGTSNNRILPIWPRNPRWRTRVFPNLWPVTRLLNVHRARMERPGQPALPLLPAGEDLRPYLMDRARETQAPALRAGYYRLDEDAGLFRPTWLGALAIGWSLGWPIGPSRHLWRRLRAWILLQALDAPRMDPEACLDNGLFMGDAPYLSPRDALPVVGPRWPGLAVIGWMVAVGLILLAMRWIALAIGLAAIFLVVVVVMSILQGYWVRARPRFIAVDLADSLPQVDRALTDRIGPDLDMLGFELRGDFASPALMPGSSEAIRVLEHPSTREVALVEASFASDQSLKASLPSVLLLSRLADGTELVTQSGGDGALLPVDPTHRLLSVPARWPVRRIVDLHRRRAAHLRIAVVPFFGQSDEIALDLAHRTRQQIVRMARAGYFWLDPVLGIYRPSWLGACRLCWMVTWPDRILRAILRSLRASAELRSLETEAVPVTFGDR